MRVLGSQEQGLFGKLPQCSEGKSKKFQHFEQRFSVHTNGEQACLSELLLTPETSTTSSTIKFSVRIGIARCSFFVNKICKIDLSGKNSWKIHATNLL